MRFRRFVALVVFPSAVALAASCAPVPFVADFSGLGGSTSGGDTLTNPSSTGSGAGGANVAIDAGGDVHWGNPVASFQYLCGGGGAVCVPGDNTDNCAQGGYPGMGGAPPDASSLSCKVVSTDGGVAAQCGMAGVGMDGDPCTKAAECGPELGCIAGLAPTCRPYCCASLESCPIDTYCVKAAMYEATQYQIPVCIPVTKCVLLMDKSCSPGLTCAIVREDGTTSCITPGTGVDGQACPCAAGYTCSSADGTCLKLCHTGSDECGTHGFCQGGTKPYPKDIGYCVSY